MFYGHRYAHAEIRTRVVVICGPTRVRVTDETAKSRVCVIPLLSTSSCLIKSGTLIESGYNTHSEFFPVYDQPGNSRDQSRDQSKDYKQSSVNEEQRIWYYIGGVGDGMGMERHTQLIPDDWTDRKY